MSVVEKTVTGEFLGLLLDEDMLRAEFDAIISAEFPDPRKVRAGAIRSIRQPHHTNRSRRQPPGQFAKPAIPVAIPEIPGRQRAPPE